MPLSALVLAAVLGQTAHAADVTDLAPELGVMGTLRYAGSALNGSLVEEETVVSGRQVARHDVDLGLEFAPIEGAALTLDLALTPALTFTYPDARPMIIEPEDGSGSYLAGSPGTEPVQVKAGGLTGFWIGAAFSPFNERYAKAQQSTWRLDAALRTPSAGRNLWTATDGKRGTAPGGLGLKLAGAFSMDLGVGAPWLQSVYVSEGKATIDVVDEAGTTWATDLEIEPASTWQTRFGVAINAYEDVDTGAAFDLDLYLGGEYRTWEDVTSGVYLPNVLDGARTIAVTTGDHIGGLAGLALDGSVNEYFQIRAGTEFMYRTPYRLEHVYEVTTSADTWQIGWFLQVQGMGSFKPE